MRGKITRGQKMSGLIYYLQGPGKHNEHTNPHMVAGRGGAVERFMWSTDGTVRMLSKDDAAAIAQELDEPHVLHETKVPWVDPKRKKAALAEGNSEVQARKIARVEDANVWQCSLALRSDEGPLGDEVWGKIAEDFMREMGFDSTDANDAGSRWVAIHHGTSVSGNDHIHIAASLVRDDGSLVKLFVPPAPGKKPLGDGPRSSQVIQELERKYNLQIDRDDQSVSPSYHQAEVVTAEQVREPAEAINEAEQQRVGVDARMHPPARDKAVAHGRSEPIRFELARRVRAAATAATEEARFVELVGAEPKVVIRPRWAESGNHVSGYSVGLVPAGRDKDSINAEEVIWYSGTSLGRDLTITQLRKQWGQEDQHQASTARRRWRTHSIDAPTIDPETVAQVRQKLPYIVPEESDVGVDQTATTDPIEVQRRQLEQARRELAGWTDYVRSIPAEDGEQVARAAGVVSGVFAAWSSRTEVVPGPLAQAANTMARTAGRSYSRPRPTMRARSSGSRAAAMLMLASAHTDPAMAWAMVMGQLLAAVEAIAEAQAAANNAAAAQRLTALREQQLAERAQRIVGTTAVVEAEPARRHLSDDEFAALQTPPPTRGPLAQPSSDIRHQDTSPRRSGYDEVLRRRRDGPRR